MTDRIPDPLAADGVVITDVASRTLVVKPALAGYAAVLWREGHRALVADQKNSPPKEPTVWAHGAGRRQIAHGQPGENGTLRFQFPLRDAAYKELVTTPGLTATIVVDQDAGRIMNVTFRGRRY